MSDMFLKGQKVTVVRSNHSGIESGETGVVDSRLGAGYAVKFEKIFPAIISHVKPKKEVRIIYFDTDQLA